MSKTKKNRITLRPLTATDGLQIYSWVLDKEVVKYSLGKWQKRYSRDEFDKWFAKTLAAPDNINLAIVLSQEDQLIGYAGFCSFDKESKKAEYFIFIGDKKEWSKGYATEVTKLIVSFGFEELKLREIMLTVSEPNIAAIKAYKKAGFKVVGRTVNATLRDGLYHDKIIMKINSKK